MKTNSESPLKPGLTIECTDSPEWGTWTVVEPAEGVPGCWNIRRDERGGERILFESEFRRFWRTVP